MSINKIFTKQNIEMYLKELAKDFKKRGRGTSVELILVGGASVILNYGFRTSSLDIDAFYENYSVLKESINYVAEKYNLPKDWLNDDFKRTNSFTYKIIEYSQYYKTFSGVLTIRTIKEEYLVAMKLVAGRRYKKDISDVVGIVYEHVIIGNPLSFELIDKAVIDLYGDWSRVSDYAKDVLKQLFSKEEPQELYEEICESEERTKEVLLEVVSKYPNAVNIDNVDNVIENALAKKKKKQEQ